LELHFRLDQERGSRVTGVQEGLSIYCTSSTSASLFAALRSHSLFGGVGHKPPSLWRLWIKCDRYHRKISGVTPLTGGSRRMHGLVEVTPEVFGNDKLRHKLLNAALKFSKSMPKKD
jgi:hypothetical protein